MQEYIDELQQKVGLTAEQAKKAIETIVTKVKSKIPEGLHGSIDSIFKFSGASASGDAPSFQQKAQEYADQAGEKLKEFGSQARKQLNDLADKAEDLGEDIQEKAQEAMEDISEKLSGYFGKKTPPPTKES